MLVPVTAALIEREGRLLVSRRRVGAHLGGLWELPGGKMEEGESPRDCLARELMEELDVRAEVHEIYDVIFHRYREFDLLLLVFRVSYLEGEPKPLDSMELRWVRPSELAELALLPADSVLAERLIRENPE